MNVYDVFKMYSNNIRVQDGICTIPLIDFSFKFFLFRGNYAEKIVRKMAFKSGIRTLVCANPMMAKDDEEAAEDGRLLLARRNPAHVATLEPVL
jgi:hypothetical protein